MSTSAIRAGVVRLLVLFLFISLNGANHSWNILRRRVLTLGGNMKNQVHLPGGKQYKPKVGHYTMVHYRSHINAYGDSEAIEVGRSEEMLQMPGMPLDQLIDGQHEWILVENRKCKVVRMTRIKSGRPNNGVARLYLDKVLGYADPVIDRS